VNKHRKLLISNTDNIKYRRWPQVSRKGRQFLLHEAPVVLLVILVKCQVNSENEMGQVITTVCMRYTMRMLILSMWLYFYINLWLCFNHVLVFTVFIIIIVKEYRFCFCFFFELCWQCSVSCCSFYYVNPLGNRIFIDIIVALYLFVCKMSVQDMLLI
jgi:hypothetical protein